MKRIFLSVLILLSVSFISHAEDIRISTEGTDLILHVSDNGRLYQTYLGERLSSDADFGKLPVLGEAYVTHGMEDYFEPAIEVHQPDGSASLLLKYAGCEQSCSGDIQTTVVTLKDEVYPITVEMHFTAFLKENVISTHTVIRNEGKKSVKLSRYASSMLHFYEPEYDLTEFSGDWAREVEMTSTRLNFGKKVLDSKLGSRADMFIPPMFILSLGGQATETQGNALLGTLGWTGNFRFTFEVDQNGHLRVISGINPYFSEYELEKGASFETPEFHFTLSSSGIGQASRNFHDWARSHQLKQGRDSRLTLLNNWEATYFDFDEEKLLKLEDNAALLGVDMFLLDDGWFGNKYPRNSDTQGLGDWQETASKLPDGIAKLCEGAREKGIKFGIWVEPEMVNPRSELYEKHPDWVIHLPNREEYYFRNQLVLDLSNPAVQDFVFSVIDRLMTDYPEIAFFKWDCNSPITNIYSPYLKDRQQHMYVDHVRGLYNVLDRVRSKYPDLRMMLCSGGGGRTDYKALSYFTEFWPSDNTNPVDRLFIQYGYSFFFPVKATCAHVTSWNRNASIKFRTDVAMMGKLGFDIRVDELAKDELAYCQQAVKEYRRLSPVTLDGDLYRLVSPYDGMHCVNMFASKDASRAVVFAFDVHERRYDKLYPVKLQGLDPGRTYHVREINMMPGHNPSVDADYTGDFLMKYGLDILRNAEMQSRIYEITAR